MVGVRGGEVEWETGEGGGVGREMVEEEVEQGASWREVFRVQTWLR